MNQSHVNKTRFLYLSNIYEDDLVIPGFSRKGARKIGVESERGADGPHPGPLAVFCAPISPTAEPVYRLKRFQFGLPLASHVPYNPGYKPLRL